MHFYVLLSWNLTRNVFFRSKILISELKEKTDLATSNQKKWEEQEKNCSETRRSMVETERFCIKLFMSIRTRENSSHLAQVFFFSWTSLSLLLDNMVQFFWYHLFFNMEIKLRQQISRKTEDKLLYRTHCHTNAWRHLIWLIHYSQSRFYQGKFLGMSEKDCLGIYKSSCRHWWWR